MSNVNGALEKARSDAQNLHKRIVAATGKDHAAIRAEAQGVAARARELAQTVKANVEGQQIDVQQHLKDAGAALESLASDAKSLASAGDANLKSKNRAALAHARLATQQLSQAVAAKRSTAQLIHS